MWTPNSEQIITSEQKAEELESLKRASIPELSSRQFWLAALEIGVTKASLLEVVNEEYEGAEREALSIEIRESIKFQRDYPLVQELATLKGISSSELDDLWAWASQI